MIDLDLKDIRGERVYFTYTLNNDTIQCRMFHKITINLIFYKFTRHSRIITNHNDGIENVGRIGSNIDKSDYYKSARKLLNRFNDDIESDVESK